MQIHDSMQYNYPELHMRMTTIIHNYIHGHQYQAAAFLPGPPVQLYPPQNVLQGGSLEHLLWQRALISIYRFLYDHSPCRPAHLSRLLAAFPPGPPVYAGRGAYTR